jgi:hypothetical protein
MNISPTRLTKSQHRPRSSALDAADHPPPGAFAMLHPTSLPPSHRHYYRTIVLSPSFQRQRDASFPAALSPLWLCRPPVVTAPACLLPARARSLPAETPRRRPTRACTPEICACRNPHHARRHPTPAPSCTQRPPSWRPLHPVRPHWSGRCLDPAISSGSMSSPTPGQLFRLYQCCDMSLYKLLKTFLHYLSKDCKRVGI